MRVAFFGGSFDPPHVAHVLAAAYLVSTGDYDDVLVVPVYHHAFDKRLAPFADRLRMCELAMSPLPGVQVSAVESSLAVPSLTVRTLQHLQHASPGHEWHLIVGSDVLAELGKWHQFEEVCRLARLRVLGRIGFEHPQAEPAVLPEVSSSEIRELLRRRDDSDSRQRLGALVPRSVLRYIDEHRLYHTDTRC